MARTIRTKVFKFNELSKSAQNAAIEQYRNNDYVYTDHIYDDAHETVKAFHEIFGTSEGNRSWLDVDCSQIDNNILELKGLRLRTYIINNFWQYLFKGKYYKAIGDNRIIKHPCIKVHRYDMSKGARVSSSNFYYSRITFDNSCTLTGVCYDMDLLQPIYEFLEWKLRPDYNSYMDFETLVTDCFASLEKSIENEVDYLNSDEGIREEIISRDELEFTKDGLIFNR